MLDQHFLEVPMTLSRLAMVVVALGSPAVAAFAQEETPPQPDPPRLNEVVDVEADLPAVPGVDLTFLKTPMPLQLTPASVTVVSRPVFQSQAALVMSDALRNSAGVLPASGFGVFDFFTVRGFDSLSSGLVLTDAVAEPESTLLPAVQRPAGGGAEGADRVPLRRQRARRRRSPRAQAAARRPLRGGEPALRPVQHRRRHRSTQTWRTRTAPLSFRLNGLTRGSDGYRDGMDSSQHAINPTLAWRPDAQSRVAFSFEYVDSEFQPDSGLPLVERRWCPTCRASARTSRRSTTPTRTSTACASTPSAG